jgi:predicted nucleic acid-binding protein
LFLLDTDIVSATSPIPRGRVGQAAFSQWLLQNDQRLFLSAITIAEIEAGVTRAERIGAAAKAKMLRRWLATVEHLYGPRILPFHLMEARHAGAIIDRARAHNPGFEDIAIAATAAARGLTVLTSNERHFAPLGVPYLNPLKALPT